MGIKEKIDSAMGRIKCDLILKNGNIINVFTNEIINGNLGILEGVIIGVGDYEGKEEIDLKGKYISPSFIDAHVHIESSMVTPPLFAKNIISRGTTTVIADPHEIANVLGLAGIYYILDSTEEIPLDVYVMLPSCVPATPFETSGAILKAKDLKKLINHPRVKGLGELMDYVGVVNGNKSIIDKLEMAKNKIIDGHISNLFGKELNAYAVSGVKTNHECTALEEMLEQLRIGFYIQMRQGTVTKDVKNLLPILNKNNLRRCLFCSDDKHPEKILERGHINENVNIAIKGGIEPIDAIKIASLNAAECYGLKGKGAIAPGYIADLIVFDCLTNIKPSLVFKNGKLVAKDRKPLFKVARDVGSEKIISKVNIKKINKCDIALHLKSNKVNVIKILPNSVLTKKVLMDIKIKNGVFFKNQKGSSAMPHKRNPIGSENMCGCARVIRGYMITAYENVALWHERDISHSSAERIIIPDSTILLNYMLNRFTNILNQLIVYPENMLKNIDKTLGLIFSQQVMLALINKGWTREKAYDTVQPLAMKTWKNQISYKLLVERSKEIGKILTKEEIAKCFDSTYNLKNINEIYKRKGL